MAKGPDSIATERRPSESVMTRFSTPLVLLGPLAFELGEIRLLGRVHDHLIPGSIDERIRVAALRPLDLLFHAKDVRIVMIIEFAPSKREFKAATPDISCSAIDFRRSSRSRRIGRDPYQQLAEVRSLEQLQQRPRRLIETVYD